MGDSVLMPGDDGVESDRPGVVPPQLQKLVGMVIAGSYRIDDVVGVGGMGVVFRGFQLNMNREVAIKVALPRLSIEQRARFQREAELGGQLDHPNCTQVYAFDTTPDGLQYMVMPFVRGSPLAQMLGQRRPPEVAAAWGIQLLRGLDHAHQRRIIHRDIKPGNILVAQDDRGRHTLRIVDLGIAKVMRSSDSTTAGLVSNETMTGVMAGTLAYMAPEQALALGCDERSDIYSVGMVMHELVVGALPHHEGDEYDALRARLTEEIPPLPASVPAPLARIIAKMLRGRREDRYQAAQDVLEDLESFLAGDPLRHVGDEGIAPPPDPRRSIVAGVPIPEETATALSREAVADTDAFSSGGPAPRRPARPSRRGHVAFGAAFASVGVALWAWYAVPRDVSSASSNEAATATPAQVAPAAEPSGDRTHAADPPTLEPDEQRPSPPPQPVEPEPPTVEPSAEPDADVKPTPVPTKPNPKRTAKRRTPKKGPKPASEPPPHAEPASPKPKPSEPPSFPPAPRLDDGLRKPSGL